MPNRAEFALLIAARRCAAVAFVANALLLAFALFNYSPVAVTMFGTANAVCVAVIFIFIGAYLDASRQPE